MNAIEKLFDHPDFIEGDHWQRKKFQPNEIVIRKNEISSDVFFVLDGILRVTVPIDINYKSIMDAGLEDLKKGALFGELNLFDKSPRSASVTAVSDCELAVINSERLLAFLDAHADVGSEVYKFFFIQLSERLRRSSDQVTSLLCWGLKVHNLADVI